MFSFPLFIFIYGTPYEGSCLSIIYKNWFYFKIRSNPRLLLCKLSNEPRLRRKKIILVLCYAIYLTLFRSINSSNIRNKTCASIVKNWLLIGDYNKRKSSFVLLSQYGVRNLCTFSSFDLLSNGKKYLKQKTNHSCSYFL